MAAGTAARYVGLQLRAWRMRRTTATSRRVGVGAVERAQWQMESYRRADTDLARQMDRAAVLGDRIVHAPPAKAGAWDLAIDITRTIPAFTHAGQVCVRDAHTLVGHADDRARIRLPECHGYRAILAV